MIPEPINKYLLTCPPSTVCDFCGGSPTVKTYKVPDFTYKSKLLNKYGELCEITQHSYGNWLACKTCAEMVAKHLWDDLALRTINARDEDDYFKQNTELRVIMLRNVKQFHAKFRELAVL